MKILALTPDSYGGFGGIAQYNRDLFDSLSGTEEVQSVLALPRSASPGVRAPAKIIERPVPGRPARYMLEALKQCLSFRPDLILCGHVNLLPAAVLVKKVTGRPLVLLAYGVEAWSPAGKVRTWSVGQVDLIVAISRYTRERLIGWTGLEPHRIKVLPNAIHLEQYSCSGKPDYLVKRYGLTGRVVLMTLGRLDGRERYKGHDRIIPLLPDLAARFPNLTYLIVGDGDDRPRLEGMVEKAGMRGRVVFAGKISEEEKVDHYNLADAFAMPSSGEGFGFVFLEAAACGAPVLGGCKDGSRDALVEGRLGEMVDPACGGQLLSGLERILRNERSVPSHLSAFSFERFSEQLKRLIVQGAYERR